jgi:hypothetical protein
LTVHKEAHYYRCGICDHLHDWFWDGDCRENIARFTSDQLNKMHGPTGWREFTMEERVKEDAKPWAGLSIDCIIGCNVRGRLQHIETLLDKRDVSGTLNEIRKLLRFFPEPKDERNTRTRGRKHR